MALRIDGVPRDPFALVKIVAWRYFCFLVGSSVCLKHVLAHKSPNTSRFTSFAAVPANPQHSQAAKQASLLTFCHVVDLHTGRRRLQCLLSTVDGGTQAAQDMGQEPELLQL